ncbi:DUF58 domain-containing protein [Aquirufa rosea]|uniref:DUF58 domain-containing protein n=1 Tax=Aquirufa rosea TaxID=2509241 RepID=A0A4Q1C1W0_9BACT|nr:DUF58 domain-containing protein [Aquirufa rosea]RXK52158.1 DUF58 domain-containing protein [Aquirufa rosea]
MLKKVAEEQSSNRLAILAEEISHELFHGKHRSIFHGYSSEFKEYKAYETGDNLKLVDWKLYGRTDKLFTKHFHDESNLSAFFFIDLSSSMYFPSESKEKIQKSIQIVAVLCKIFHKQRDKFGLLGISDDVIWESPLSNSKSHLQATYHQLETLLGRSSIDERSELPSALASKILSIGQRKMIFVVSDLLFDNASYDLFLKSLSEIKANKNTIKILHIWDQSEHAIENDPNKIMQWKDIETNQVISLHSEEWNQLQIKQKTQFLEQRINPLLNKGFKYYSLCANESLYELIRQII